ncbi:hypothetical protein P261_01312 [Lachnospiraceae bacterium TWA4]|nr:hypothetical protein P261_01312 [Lachnospiraceae bacterium TWA4]
MSQIITILNTPEYLLILGGILALLVILQIITMIRLGSLKKKYRRFMTGSDSQNLEDVIVHLKDTIDDLYQENSKYQEEIEQIYEMSADTFSKKGIVRYDALDDITGKLSVAFVLLNSKNDGFLMNSIHTRSGSYVYLRDIKDGTCDVKLGKDEEKALEEALNYR